ncbi:hypothetical protein AB0D86_47200 [Streptomyces sp. NPDC048324]|uniref:hypothetical protein n=1 Tax=Streptomyces sp. NPDC048324 TaxID=3157205 RepID=UPI003433BD10
MTSSPSTPSVTLTIHRGTGTGALGGTVSGFGWPTTAQFVPFGDLGSDHCNDVLVRGGGALRAYRPACGRAATPTTSYTSLGTSGWSAYDILTSPAISTATAVPT